MIPGELVKKGINLAPAIHSDIPEIMEFMKNFYEMFGYPFDAKLAKQNLKDFIHDPALGRIWLIRENELAVGYVVLTFGFSFSYGGRDAVLDEFYLMEKFRGRGIGKEIMKLVLEASKGFNLTGLHLEVEKNNKAAKKLYESIGFDLSKLEWHHLKIE